MQLTIFTMPQRSLIQLTQVLTEQDVDKLQDAFAGRTIYIPKRSGRKIAVQFIASNPEATREMVIAVCGISRATYYRALREVQDGRND